MPSDAVMGTNDIMKNMAKKIGDLAPLASFNPAAFKGDGVVSQDVCNFVLTSALIFNDLKDLISAQVTLQTQKPTGIFKISRVWGDYNGIDLHLWRLMIGLFHEVVELIKRSDKVLVDPFFQSVLKKLRKTELDIWLSLVDVVKEKTIPAEHYFALLVRHKVVFHYDPKEIYRGYNAFFISGAHGAEKAFVSRGNDMEHTRHFFADAAVTGYLKEKGDVSGEVIIKVIQTLTDLNFVLTDIVDKFMQMRGYAYKVETEET